MSGVGSSELIILLLIGLIVLGPKRLPQIANQLGSWIGQARRMTRAMRRQLEDELNFDDDFNIKPPKISAPFEAHKPDHKAAIEESEALAAEIPADDVAEDHIPNEDDTYSPLHDDEDESVAEDDADDEKSA
jgi:sec-independent protein translocase protein TatB